MVETIVVVGAVFAALMVLAFGMRIVAVRLKVDRPSTPVEQPQEERSRELGDLKATVQTMQAEMTRLRDRVAVLERLATDDDRRLSHEIADLGREQPTA